MNKMVGIKFKPAGKVYNFDSGAFVLNGGDHVIVETEQGLGFGYVAVIPSIYDEKSFDKPLKKVFRLASEEDFEQRERNLDFEKQAFDYCIKSIESLEFKMSLFSVETTFDESKLIFFFTAEGRVDFRKLVKMLSKKFHVKISMRQVGIRNQAKMCGGLGRCGREICCSAFMDKFVPVSIRMAKEQSLSLNPTKISGQCGRLMCCLTFENDTYMQLRKKFPAIGKKVITPDGKGKVIRHNVICDRLTVRIDKDNIIEYALKDIKEE
ncbi:MAG: stage 0 sporulation family protein [Deltaproteobacteria bacterium]|nr:stage 0 sporulation family protein [Deltaproteobacteria bacterium]